MNNNRSKLVQVIVQAGAVGISLALIASFVYIIPLFINALDRNSDALETISNEFNGFKITLAELTTFLKSQNNKR